MMGAMPTTGEVLASLVDRVTFHNAENGFCVLRVKARGQRDLITVVGHATMISAGELAGPCAFPRQLRRGLIEAARRLARHAVVWRSFKLGIDDIMAVKARDFPDDPDDSKPRQLSARQVAQQPADRRFGRRSLAASAFHPRRDQMLRGSPISGRSSRSRRCRGSAPAPHRRCF